MFNELIGVFTGQNRAKKRRCVATGVVAGLLTGLTAGLLLAPKSGAETRKDIQDAACKGAKLTKDYANQAAQYVSEKSTELYGAAKGKVNQLLSKGSDAVEEAAKKARQAARNARMKAKAEAAEAAEAVEEAAEDVKEDVKKA